MKLIASIFLFLMSCIALGADSFIIKQTDIHYLWDGDTFKVFCDDISFPCKKKKLSIRIANINTPEINGKCDYEIKLARKALAAARSYLHSAEHITITPNKRLYDRNNRLLATVSVDKIDLGKLLVKDSLARLWSGKRESWCN